jgi:hypothetical protein
MQITAAFLHVVAIEQARARHGNQCLKFCFPLVQGHVAQVSPVAPNQIEGVKVRLTATVQQFVELAAAFGIQADYLAVQNRASPAKRISQVFGQQRKGLEHVSVARHQTYFAAITKCQRAEAIMFDFEEPVRAIERFGKARKAQRFDAGDVREHHSSLAGLRTTGAGVVERKATAPACFVVLYSWHGQTKTVPAKQMRFG